MRQQGIPSETPCALNEPSLDSPLSWACSSVVEHCVDIAGVASSILATPTTSPSGEVHTPKAKGDAAHLLFYGSDREAIARSIVSAPVRIGTDPIARPFNSGSVSEL